MVKIMEDTKLLEQYTHLLDSLVEILDKENAQESFETLTTIAYILTKLSDGVLCKGSYSRDFACGKLHISIKHEEQK